VLGEAPRTPDRSINPGVRVGIVQYRLALKATPIHAFHRACRPGIETPGGRAVIAFAFHVLSLHLVQQNRYYPNRTGRAGAAWLATLARGRATVPVGREKHFRYSKINQQSNRVDAQGWSQIRVL
jgi:hypothetical protein